MTTKIIVDNGFSRFRAFDIFNDNFKIAGRKALLEWQRAIIKRAVFGMRRSKSGRKYIYKIAKRGQKPDAFVTYNGRRMPAVRRRSAHRASAQGQYPATDTGRLWRSIRKKTMSSGFRGMVYTQVKYGKYLEEKHPRRGGRPFLSRAAKEKEKLGAALVLEALKKSVRRSR